MQRDSSVTLVSLRPKKTILEEKKKITSAEVQISAQIFFGHKEIEHISFQKSNMRKPAQTDFSKGMWGLIPKGLKHLNTVASPC